MFYLLNRASKSRTIFTVGFLASRSSKLDPALIDLQNQTKKLNREHGFFPFPKKARPCLSQNHNRASRGSKTVTLVKGQKNRKRVFFPFPRGTAVTLAKAQPCLSRNQNRDSRERKKNRKRVFSFARGTAVTLAKAKPCLSRKQNRDSRERKKKKTRFFAQNIFFDFWSKS